MFDLPQVRQDFISSLINFVHEVALRAARLSHSVKGHVTQLEA